MENSVILQIIGLTKCFPGVKALDNMQLTLKKGEVMALAGENGAGKSTLIKILSGVYRPDGGTVVMDGREVRFDTPAQAEAAGVYTVHQELSVFPLMNVADNIFVNREPRTKTGLIDYKRLHADAQKILAEFELGSLSTKALVGTLDIARQQAVEILRATGFSPRILILDEPTSALTIHDTQLLFKTIRKLKEAGTSILYISHRLEEVFEICDRVTIMRDGKHIETCPIQNITQDEIVRLMVGRDVAYDYGRDTSLPGKEVLRVEGFGSGAAVKNVSFCLNHGEVLGIGGLEGSGRTELLEALFGCRRISTGSIHINGEAVKIKSPSDARKHGLAYITKDRKKIGLFIRMSIEQNLLGGNLGNFSKNGVVQFAALRRTAEHAVEQFDIRTTSIQKLVNALSGGNQQKVLLAMWLYSEPDIILVDEPTRGIDVGTKEYIHKILRGMASRGKAVLMVSSDMPELLSASDRIVVMSGGEMSGLLTGKERTEYNVMTLAVKNMQRGNTAER